MMIKKPFDEKCLGLADYFLPEESDDTRRDLAAAIQAAAEDFGVPGANPPCIHQWREENLLNGNTVLICPHCGSERTKEARDED